MYLVSVMAGRAKGRREARTGNKRDEGCWYSHQRCSACHWIFTERMNSRVTECHGKCFGMSWCNDCIIDDITGRQLFLKGQDDERFGCYM